MRKDSQRSCVKRSCIQDIGWQIGFRWRGGRHLLCIPTPLYRNNIQLLLPAFTNGASRALRKINIFHLSLQVLFLALLFSNIIWSSTDSILFFLSPSGDLGISLVWRNLSGPDRHFSVRLLKSSQSEQNYLWGVLSCSQDDIRWF